MTSPPLSHAPESAHAALLVMHEIGGDDLVVLLVRTFVEYADAQLPLARQAAAAGDGPAVAKVAHALKSSAEQVGAHGLATACEAAERAAGGGDVATSHALVAAMLQDYATAREWMARILAQG